MGLGLGQLMRMGNRGTLAMVKAFAPLVIETRGVVANVGSSAGLINIPWNGTSFYPPLERRIRRCARLTEISGIYASSKAAVNLLSETLRLELEPLNVRVVTAVIGIAKSEFFTNLNQTEFELPSSSLYKSLETRIAVSATGADLPANAMSAEQCGRDLVRDVLRGKRGNVYNGTGGFALKWIMPLLPTPVVVSLDFLTLWGGTDLCRIGIARVGRILGSFGR